MKVATWLLLVSLPSLVIGQCPAFCTCQPKRRADPASEPAAMTCSSSGLKLSQLAAPSGLLSLNVSRAGLTAIYQADFAGIPATLTAMNLSRNNIQYVQNGAFVKFGSLQILDLSYNDLDTVNTTMFDGLKNLQQLSLSYNRLRTVPDTVVLSSLLQLDFNSAYLVCDCNILWITRMKRRRPDLQVIGTRCALPTALRNTDVQILKRSQLPCDLPVELLEFEVLPSTGQVVFAGDSVPFVCHVAADYNQTTVYWLREGVRVETNRSQGIILQAVHSGMDTVMRHSLTLTIEHLHVRHGGAWKCQVDTPVGTVEKSVNIIVISESTAFCAPLHLRTNKGVFNWPKTVAGVRQELPCDKKEGGKAYYQCSADGHWQELNLAQCRYTDIITRTLEELSSHGVNDTADILKVGSSLQTLLTKPESIQDKMDVVFISRFLSAATSRAPGQRRELPGQVSQLIVNITSMMMNVNRNLLQAAQREEQACSSIVYSLERMLLDALAVQKVVAIRMENIAAEGHRFDSGSVFLGLTCNSSIGGAGGALRWRSYTMGNFQCSAGLGASDVGQFEKVETFLRIPDIVFGERSQATERKVVVIFYRNDNLFQRPRLPSSTSVQSAVISAIVTAGDKTVNVSAPLTLGWQSLVRGGMRQLPAKWDMDDWSNKDCLANHSIGNLSLASCHMTGAFALLQDLSLAPENGGGSTQELAIFRALQVPFYVGTVACIVAMFVVITTYCVHFSYIRLSKKLKHCLINTCVCILLLDVVFAAGIRTQLDSLCKAVGICIHYFSICVIFWITVTSWNTYKKLRRHRYPILSLATSYGDTGDGSQEGMAIPPPPKPMLKFYLFAWGIPIIICGITAAVNINFYNTGRYCFLAWDPSLLAFYGVVGFFVLINCLLFTCMSFALAKRKGNDQLAAMVAMQQLDEVYPPDDDGHVTDGDLSTIPLPASSARARAAAAMSPSVISSEADEEYRPGAQMAGIVLLLLLYVLVWTSGALAIAAPFEHVVPNMEEIFGYMYMGFSIILGLFVVIFYCFARNDTRWRRRRPSGDGSSGCGIRKRPDGGEAAPDVVDGTGRPATPTGALGRQLSVTSAATTATTTPVRRGGESSDCGGGMAAKSVHSIDYVSSLLRAADAHNRQTCSALSNGSHLTSAPSPLPGYHRGEGGPSPPAAGAAAAAMQQGVYPATNAASAFYNARQNGIARKYWEKASKLQKMRQLAQSTAAGGRCSSDGESTRLLNPLRESMGDIHRCLPPASLPPPPPPPVQQQQHCVWQQRQRLASAASEPPCETESCLPASWQQQQQHGMATPDILAGSAAASLAAMAAAQHSSLAAVGQHKASALQQQHLLQPGLPAGYRRQGHRVHHSDNELDVGMAKPFGRSANASTARDSAHTLGRKASAAQHDPSRLLVAVPRPGYIAGGIGGLVGSSGTGDRAGVSQQQQPRVASMGHSEPIPDVCKDLGRAGPSSAAGSGSMAHRSGDGSPAAATTTAGTATSSLARSSMPADRCSSPWSSASSSKQQQHDHRHLQQQHQHQHHQHQYQQHQHPHQQQHLHRQHDGLADSQLSTDVSQHGQGWPIQPSTAADCSSHSHLRQPDCPAAGTERDGDAMAVSPSTMPTGLPMHDSRRPDEAVDKSVSPYACITVVPTRAADPSQPSCVADVSSRSTTASPCATVDPQLYENSAAIMAVLTDGDIGRPTYENISGLLAAEAPLYENFTVQRSLSPAASLQQPIYENLSELASAVLMMSSDPSSPVGPGGSNGNMT